MAMFMNLDAFLLLLGYDFVQQNVFIINLVLLSLNGTFKHVAKL